jgi:hypothetical protein
MESPSQIVKPEVVEIVPRPNLAGVEVAITKLKTETEKIEPLRVRAKALMSTPAITATPAQAQEAKSLQLEIRTIGKAAALNLDPYWAVVNAARDALSQIYSGHEDPAKAIDDELKTWVKSFETEEKRRAKVEEDRREQERLKAAQEKADAERKERERLAKVEKDKKIADIKAAQKLGEIGKREAARLLREAGASEEAAIEQAAADAEAAVEAAKNAPREQVKPDLRPMAGVPSRTNYKAQVTDANLLIEAYIRTFAKPVDVERRIYLRQFITINEQRVGEEARKMKDSKKMATLIPGVRFYED